jgi:hypothetical protein
MQEQPIPDPAEELDEAERDIVYLLTDPDDNQPIWSVDDIGREIESTERAQVAVNGLARAGLVNRTSDKHVFATRAAVRMVQVVGHGVI